MKICVIEDNSDMRRLIELILNSQGHEVKSYSNGEKALNSLKNEKDLPEIIFVDNYMPCLSGPEFREAQIQDDRLRKIKTFLLTASLEYEIEKYKKSFDGCISKVMLSSDKLSRVIKTVERKQRTVH